MSRPHFDVRANRLAAPQGDDKGDRETAADSHPAMNGDGRER